MLSQQIFTNVRLLVLLWLYVNDFDYCLIQTISTFHAQHSCSDAVVFFAIKILNKSSIPFLFFSLKPRLVSHSNLIKGTVSSRSQLKLSKLEYFAIWVF